MENPFKWRHYQGEIIILCVHWYLPYALSYRDMAEMMSERGLQLVHTTMFLCKIFHMEVLNRILSWWN